MEYVYVLDFGNRIKIGRTKDIENRIRNLETQSWCMVIQSHYKEFLNAVLVENKMHKIFCENRWLWEYFFDISFETIRDKLNVITEDRLPLKDWYNGLDKEEKIIYLLKKSVDTYYEDSNLWKHFVRTIDKKWINKEKLWNINRYNLEEMEKDYTYLKNNK